MSEKRVYSNIKLIREELHMFNTFDKLKKHAANASAAIVKNIKSMNIQPCDGPSYEYSSNDDDYNEFLKNMGSEQADYINIPNPNIKESKSAQADAPEVDAINEQSDEKSEASIKKKIDNISDTIFDKFNQIKSSIETNKTVSNAEDFEKTYALLDELSANIDELSVLLTSIKDSTDKIEKTTKNSTAEISIAIEKLSHDISAITAYISDSDNKMSEFESTITQQTAEFEKMKVEYTSLNKIINGLSADLSDVSANQQMSKNSILALAESFDSLNKKITIGFVTLGVITSLSVIVQIVFNIL